MCRPKLSVALLFSVFWALVLGAFARPAAAQQMSSAVCGTDNLLARRLPSARTQEMRGDMRLVTDGSVAQEGAQWDAPVGVFFDTPAGTATWDLGEVRPVSSFLIQADANDTYKIFGAEVDSPSAYRLLVEVESVVNIGHGLRTRTATIEPTPVRYLRIGEPLGDGAYSLSEFQAYCRAPSPFPPALNIVNAPAAKVVAAPWYKFYWFENDASARFEMVLAILGAALIGWGVWLRQKGKAERHRKLRDALLIALGVISFCCYFNFFLFHFRNYLHSWDTFHYYAGSKYFKELSYDRLYECIAVADSEEPGLRRRVELRKVMNLRNNMMEGTGEILAHPENCKKHFTPERWQAFKKDVAFFRAKHDVKRWEELQTDHGYNGTPVWNIAGTLLSNTGPATEDQVSFLTRIDPFFIVGITLMCWWAFGWRTVCVALAVLATNFPSRFYWTGGAFLRWDWLFYFCGGICLVKKEKPLLGGIFLGYSTLLRVFPIFVFTGPVLMVVRQLWGTHTPDSPAWRIKLWRDARFKNEDRYHMLTIYKPEPAKSLRALIDRIDRRYLRLFGGAALIVAILMPLSLATSGGIDGYRAFIYNTNKHKETPLTNHMGLRTVVTYNPAQAGRALKNDRAEDPWGVWKRTKVQAFQNRRPLYMAFVAGFVLLLFAATRNAEPWMACSMGAMMIAVGIELTCYYYSFLFAVTFLYKKREEVGAILLAATAATGFIDWAPTKYLPDKGIWANLKMSQWLDEQYMFMSVATLVAFVWIMYRFGYPPVNEVATAADEPDAAAAPARKGRGNKPARGRGRRK
jgi:hypothetical protein